MMLASVSPGPKRCALIVCDEPMSNATAMVSPIARPRPIITAETTPPRLCGNTEPRIISQRVEPRPYAASFSGSGVVANTSRVSEVMIGVIMIATMIPAVMKLSPVGLGSAVSSFTSGIPEVAEEMLEYTSASGCRNAAKAQRP